MELIQTEFADLYIIQPKVYKDERGYFVETYRKSILEHFGIQTQFVQDNESESGYGVIRGLHYQLSPMAQSKLVRVVLGTVLDVVVDIRETSETFGKHFSILLSGENKKQLLIPKGFAHGYAVLSEKATFSYKCDQYYSKEHEGGIHFDDKTLFIDWSVPAEKQIISEKDSHWPRFGMHRI